MCHDLMRRLLAFFALRTLARRGAASPQAADAPRKGLWLLTDYPSQTVRPARSTTIR